MARKQYEKLINANLASLAVESKYWSKKDRKQIAEWDDSIVADFFRMMVDTVKEDIESGAQKGTIAHAFMKANLPPDDPFNWTYILQAFTDVHFHSKRGGRIKHDEHYRDVLWQRLRPIVLKQESRDLVAACRQLVKKFPSDYGAVTAADALMSNKAKKDKAEINARKIRFRIKRLRMVARIFR